jgi:hypothetical protein
VDGDVTSDIAVLKQVKAVYLGGQVV